jgi:type IV pilus assembly protein PilQ
MPSEEGKALIPLLEKWKSPVGQIQYIDKLNMLVISDADENIPLMEKILQVSSIVQPQIMIETLVIERVIKSDLQLGWEDTWTRPATSDTFFRKTTQSFQPGAYLQSLAGGGVLGGFQGSTLEFNRTGHHGTLDIKLRMMVERGDARILSSPRIMVSSGEKASISSGQEVPYQQVTYPGGGASTSSVIYKQAVIKLDVTAAIINENVIRLTVAPQVTTLSGYMVIAGAETPYFATRSADTKVSLKSGEKITIGGLVREEDVTSERGIPYLSDIPILGWLFKKYQKDKNKTEIIFIIKPYLITTPEETKKPRLIIEEHKER